MCPLALTLDSTCSGFHQLPSSMHSSIETNSALESGQVADKTNFFMASLHNTYEIAAKETFQPLHSLERLKKGHLMDEICSM